MKLHGNQLISMEVQQLDISILYLGKQDHTCESDVKLLLVLIEQYKRLGSNLAVIFVAIVCGGVIQVTQVYFTRTIKGPA